MYLDVYMPTMTPDKRVRSITDPRFGIALLALTAVGRAWVIYQNERLLADQRESGGLFKAAPWIDWFQLVEVLILHLPHALLFTLVAYALARRHEWIRWYPLWLALSGVSTLHAVDFPGSSRVPGGDPPWTVFISGPLLLWSLLYALRAPRSAVRSPLGAAAGVLTVLTAPALHELTWLAAFTGPGWVGGWAIALLVALRRHRKSLRIAVGLLSLLLLFPPGIYGGCSALANALGYSAGGIGLIGAMRSTGEPATGAIGRWLAVYMLGVTIAYCGWPVLHTHGNVDIDLEVAGEDRVRVHLPYASLAWGPTRGLGIARVYSPERLVSAELTGPPPKPKPLDHRITALRWGQQGPPNLLRGTTCVCGYCYCTQGDCAVDRDTIRHQHTKEDTYIGFGVSVVTGCQAWGRLSFHDPTLCTVALDAPTSPACFRSAKPRALIGSLVKDR